MAPTLVLTLQLLAKRSSSRPRNTTSSSRAAAAAVTGENEEAAAAAAAAAGNDGEQPPAAAATAGVSAVVAADCAGLGFRAIDDLSAALSLRRLDLARNLLSSPKDLAGLSRCKSLTQLDLSGNQLETLGGLGGLVGLKVLNVSHNKITRLSKELLGLTNLNALILNNNSISRIENLQNLTELNTLVISHNSLKAVVGVDKLQKLKKLSASHNNITELPDLSSLSALRELRLSHNEIVQLPPIYTKLPPEIEILDLGHNRLASLPSVTKSLSQRASKLRQLNLKGNSVCEVDGYRNTILAVATSLKILDGERFDPKFLERREKRRIANTKNEESESKRSEASKGVSSAFNGSGPRPLHMMVENDTETSEKPRDQAAKKRGGAALPESNSKRQKLSSDRPSEAVAKGGETPAQSDVKAPSGNSSAGPNTVAKSKGNPKASSSDEGGPPTNAPSTVPPNRTAPVKKGEAEPWMTTDDVRARSGVVAVIDATKNKRGRGKKHPNVVPMDPSQLVPGFGDLGTTRVVGGWD